ncbi:hypothetical protein Q7P36_004625 [Cladosporium allicinum]
MLSSHLTSLLALAGFLVATTASSSLKPRADGPCLDLLYSEPQCCSMDGSDCNYSSDDDDVEALKAACEGEGSRAMCCTLPSGPSVPLCREVVG